VIRMDPDTSPYRLMPWLNKADEYLMIAAQAFMEHSCQGDSKNPTYSYFRVCTEIMGGRVIKIPRNEDFNDSIDSIIANA